MTPYKDYGNLRPNQKRYNKRLSSARVMIERAFGQLKGRFRRLMKFDVQNFELLCHTILAACVMHNLCVRNEDEPMEELVEHDLNAALPRPYNEEQAGAERRKFEQKKNTVIKPL